LTMKNTAVHISRYFKRKLDQKKIENHYFSMGSNHKSYSARWIDRSFGSLLIFGIIGAVIFLISQNLFLAFVVGTSVTLVNCIVRKRFTVKRIIKGKEQLMKKDTIKMFNNSIKKIRHKDFFILIKRLLEDSGYFSQLKLDLDSSDEPVIMEGSFAGERVGIFCRKQEKEQKVKVGQLKEFVAFCMNRGLNEGIFVTSGYFDYYSKEYAGSLEDFRLYIADVDSIYNIFLKKGMLFCREEIEKQLEGNILDRKEAMEHRTRKVLAHKKIRTYVVLGLLLAFYSRYVDLNYKLYYIFISIVLFCLAVTAVVRWYIEKYRCHMETEIRLEQHT